MSISLQSSIDEVEACLNCLAELVDLYGEKYVPHFLEVERYYRSRSHEKNSLSSAMERAKYIARNGVQNGVQNGVHF